MAISRPGRRVSGPVSAWCWPFLRLCSCHLLRCKGDLPGHHRVTCGSLFEHGAASPPSPAHCPWAALLRGRGAWTSRTSPDPGPHRESLPLPPSSSASSALAWAMCSTCSPSKRPVPPMGSLVSSFKPILAPLVALAVLGEAITGPMVRGSSSWREPHGHPARILHEDDHTFSGTWAHDEDFCCFSPGLLGDVAQYGGQPRIKVSGPALPTYCSLLRAWLVGFYRLCLHGVGGSPTLPCDHLWHVHRARRVETFPSL